MAASPPALNLPEAVGAPRPQGITQQTSATLSGNTFYADVTEDNDLDTDDEDDIDASANDGDDASSLVAVSISRAQNDMKSPTTPAAMKAQALNASRDYFQAEPENETQLFDEPSGQETPPEHPRANPRQQANKSSEPEKQIQPTPSPWRAPSANQKPDKRSSLVSSILDAAGSYTRPRASSGSSIVDGIRKRLPNMPSMSMPRFYEFSGFGDSSRPTLGPAGPGLVRPSARSQAAENTQRPLEGSEGLASPLKSSQQSTSRDGGPCVSNDKPRAQKPDLLRRSTSDQSLYLRKAATGASEFDDYNAFANVSEMVNSRFKAISDTWQDSSLRMPKLPSMNHREYLRPRQRTNSDETRSNTRMNTGSLLQPRNTNENQQRASPSDASTSKHPVLKEALSRTEGDLVILGGYRGSILREAQPPHRQLWVPIKVGMNLRKADLEVGLTRKDELKMEDKIIPGGTLSHVGPVDICRRLIRKCRKCPNVQDGKLRIHDYGYDWRLSPDLLADRFIGFIEALPCNRRGVPTEERGVWVIAHSLGGLLTRYAVNKRPGLFAGVVYAGTPQNCVNILGPMRNGDDVLFSSRVLTAQVNFTLRTSYVLLPQDGRCFINKQTEERYDIDFFDANSWDEYRLSPCIKPALPRQRPERKMSIMGSISEAMSQPAKRGSWLPSWNNDTSSSSHHNQPPSVGDKLDDAKDDVADAAEAAKPEAPLSPALAGGSSQSSKNKPTVATQSTIPVPLAKAYLANTLSSVLDFKQSLSHIPDLQSTNAYPPAGILFAKNTPTVYGAFVQSREAIKYDDAFEELAFAAGDGVVLASAAQLPTGYRCVRGGRIESERGHVGLLGDLEGVGQCLGAVIDARRRKVGLGAYDR